MKLSYRIGDENMQQTKRMMLAQEPNRPISVSQLFYAELFVSSEVDHDKSIAMGNIPVIYFLSDIYFFARENKDKTEARAKNICDVNQSYWMELCKVRERLTLTSGSQEIKLPFPTEDHIAALAKKFVQGYIKRVPELASYTGMKDIEKQFGFTL